MPTGKTKKTPETQKVELEPEELRGLAQALKAAATALRQDLEEAELLRLADALERLSATVARLGDVASGASPKRREPREPDRRPR